MGVVGIPPVGCMPSQRLVGGGLSGDCAADRNQLAQTYNAKLNVELQRLNSNLQGSKLFYVDVYSIMLDFIQCPWKYGMLRNELVLSMHDDFIKLVFFVDLLVQDLKFPSWAAVAPELWRWPSCVMF